MRRMILQCPRCDKPLSRRNRSGFCQRHTPRVGRRRHPRAKCPCGAEASLAGGKFCSKICASASFRGMRVDLWKDDAGVWAGRSRAQRLIPVLGACERCGKPGYDRHHRDHDPTHNTLPNLEVLCRSCHQKEHR